MQKEVNTDYLLWKRIKAGETQAFHELYMLYAEILFSFGTIYSKDQELIKDCIHDLFFDLFKYRKNLADNDHIRNYLFKSLKRKIQSPKSRKLSLVYTSAYQEESEKKSSTLALDDNESQEETIEKIKKAMVKLSDHQQEVLHLKFQVGLSYPEIAKILEISVESVRTLVYRAVKTIKEELKVNSKALILFHIQVSHF
ncbi:MAG: sigma-70 family RNA polymerase sigma factor [Prolixibacteraceae bacterium]|nr:sigma-70 family RNA polymerase sigma factor [Prolixibacteraceae bacterium]